MGFIYVNFEGVNGKLDLFKIVVYVCEIFVCMVMNDEEIVVLVVGGYMVGKCYGNGSVEVLGFDLEGVGIEEVGFGWMNYESCSIGCDMVLSGIEGVWMIYFI